MKYILSILAITVLSCFHFSAKSQSCPKFGPYITAKFSTKTEADVLMADVLIPAAGNTAYTYTCAIQFGIGKSGGYCGLQNCNGDDGLKRPLNNIFSVWDFPNKVQIQAAYKDPLTNIGGFGGEGTGLHSHADFGWVPGQWYTNVVRRWWTGGDKTMVGYFIYDHSQKQWRHYTTFAVPEADAKLHGKAASFLENFADDKKRSRISYYKSYWQLTTDNKWIKPDSLVAGAGEGFWDVEAFGAEGVKLTSCGPEFLIKKPIAFPVNNNEAAPSIITPAEIYETGAYYDKAGKNIYVNWSVKDNTSPQLSYQVALYDNYACRGQPIATAQGTNPDARQTLLQTNSLSTEKKTYFVLLTVKDIFNQSSKPKKFSLKDMKP